MHQQPTILDIAKYSEDHYKFALIRPPDPSQPFSGPIQQVWDVTVDATIVGILCEKITEAINQANLTPETPNTNFNPFVTAGKGLYNELLPRLDLRVDELRRALRELQTPLLISTDDPNLFWELLYDEESKRFIGVDYEVGRRLKTRSVPNGVPRRDEVWRCLLIADPNADEPNYTLPDTAKEAVQLREWLVAKKINCDYLQGKDATLRSVLEKLLENQYDIIHYAGHVVSDEKTHEYALRLNGGQLFTAGAIKRQVRGNPIVFLNGCWSGKAVEGLTDAFLEAGAQLVIGSLFEAPDEGARVFAEKFYELILSGKTVGEAMKVARQQVMGKKEYAAAWACFVMYGDPCLRIELKIDELQELLNKIGLSRTDFEISCCRVVEQAFEYGRPAGVFGTPHLFAAMVGGENSHLRDRLREQRVPLDDLRTGFQDAFKIVASVAATSAKVEFSNNARDILRQATDTVQSAKREKINELDLLEAFVRKQGGSTGEHLRRLHVNVEALAPGWKPQAETHRPPVPPLRPSQARESIQPRPAVSLPKTLGPTRLEELDDSGRQVMERMLRYAYQTASATVGSPHLWLALTDVPRGYAQVALRKQGVSPDSLTNLLRKGLARQSVQTEMRIGAHQGLVLSDTVVRVLELAKTLAAQNERQFVGEYDLWRALVQQDGGRTGRLLQEVGLVIEALDSPLLLEDGRLDVARCDAELQVALQEALHCAQEMGHPGISTTHLIIGLASPSDGLFCRILSEQNLDIRGVRDKLERSLPLGGEKRPSSSIISLDCRKISPRLLGILCIAERLASEESIDKVGERQVLLAFVRDGGGETANILRQAGVNLRTLIHSLGGERSGPVLH